LANILKASWILKKGCFWIVGNDNNIRIWEDRWINPQAGKSTWTPKPANPTITTVNELIDPSLNRWKTQLISQTFWPIETNQILQIPLPSPNIEDTISWQGTKDGTYTVRSGYNAQIEWEHPTIINLRAATIRLITTYGINSGRLKLPPNKFICYGGFLRKSSRSKLIS
jgi:hypothetical protein